MIQLLGERRDELYKELEAQGVQKKEYRGVLRDKFYALERTYVCFPDSTLRGNAEIGVYKQVEVALVIYLFG